MLANLIGLTTLSKCVPLLFLPLGVSLTMLLAALRWRLKSLIIVPLVILYAFGTPAISDQLMRSLEDRFPYRSNEECPKADAVFVFGGMLGLRDHPGASIPWNDAAERFDRAVQLYKVGSAGVLVLSGGPQRYENGPTEGQTLKERASALGVPNTDIVVTEETFNTEQEASAIRQLVVLKRWKKVLIVTSAYHMPRAMRLSAGGLAELTPVPVAYETPDPGTSWAYKRPDYYLPQARAVFISERALREYMGIFFIAITGTH